MILSSWVLSILGIIVISLIIEIILPTGKTVKLIKSVLGVFTIFIMISPLNKINISDISSSIFTAKLEIDSEFVEKRKEEILEEYETEIIKSLEENGYFQIKINLDIEKSKNEFKIKTIFVDIREMVLKTESLNINKYTNIMAIIKNIIKVEDNKIIFYE
ncbi:MAG: stage III sporulation protein AF [Clostridia bacterium]|nr:stage III sporulation protein AF [Clostridia bacterium]